MAALPASATRRPDRVGYPGSERDRMPIRVIMACEAGRTLIGLKDLRTPRVAVPAEERVRPLDRPGFQLDDPPRASQCGERDTAEQRGAKRLHRERQLGCVFAALGAASGQFPPSLVPRTELVGDVEDDRDVVGIAPAGKRRADID